MPLPAGHLKTPSLAVAPSTPRNSPFRRPVSPSSPANLRQTTPLGSPFKTGQVNNNSRFAAASSNTGSPPTPTGTAESVTPKAQAAPVAPAAPAAAQSAADMFGSPRQRAPPVSTASTAPISGHGNALSQLQPAQVRTLREGFQILDRDSDGVVNREDVTDMLNQLGLPSTATDVSRFFSPSAPQQTITLANFLNSIATGLATLAPSAELLSALSSFDDDDSGQIDVAELRDALLHTAPEPGERGLTAAEIDEVMTGFSGKRAFGGKTKGGAGGFNKRADVFRYQEFVNSLSGGGNEKAEAAAEEEAED
ncbi:Myosin regulatory light chain 1 [Cytospora mali]|uniref:Myosin regulatory light chain 1 n=1 Tax=Cytospora mali TaxID=578113 RepID=A0A194VLK9_CYTMA|nr:Myosin regulatory light chain 1 [Valsa mali]